jgi:hypothetical protein
MYSHSYPLQQVDPNHPYSDQRPLVAGDNMSQQGQAAGYYQNYQQGPPQDYGNNNYGYQAPQGPPPQQQYGQGYQHAPPQGPPAQQNYDDPSKYTQPAPTYQPPQDSKEGFDQTFKVEKPKWNDLWAGLLFIATFLGFVVCLNHQSPILLLPVLTST